MGRINVGRVILGGVVAAIIIDASETVAAFLFQAQTEEVMANLGLAEPTSWVMALFVALGFVMGVALVWLYAAVRPRFGAGPKTALMVGLFFWLVAYFLPLLGDNLMGIMPTGNHVPERNNMGKKRTLAIIRADSVLRATLATRNPMAMNVSAESPKVKKNVRGRITSRALKMRTPTTRMNRA